MPAGSADIVLTFRNVHNWRFGATDQTQVAFDQMFAMVKPGGTPGVVEHHLPEASGTIAEARRGYMKRSSIFAYATKAGLGLVGESPIDANWKETHAYPKGVWTLSSGFADGYHDRARYAAIGESDVAEVPNLEPAVRDWRAVDTGHRVGATPTAEHAVQIGEAVETYIRNLHNCTLSTRKNWPRDELGPISRTAKHRPTCEGLGENMLPRLDRNRSCFAEAKGRRSASDAKGLTFN